MRILLLGDYSNVHATLADGLRYLGHEVLLASDGDGWKNYPRDVDLSRKSLSTLGTLGYLFKVVKEFRKFKNFDVVQLINPIFLPLKAKRLYPFYRYLRRHNKKVFLGAYGMDYYYVKACLDCKTFRYSDFNFGAERRFYPDAEAFIQDWYLGDKGKLNHYIASDCNGIIAGLYEYFVSYQNDWQSKLTFIPFPIRTYKPIERDNPFQQINFFIGIQKLRSVYKGTDIMLKALKRLQLAYPKEVIISKSESLPFNQYTNLLNKADVLLDQLYSYTPAMNALEAMSRGIVVVGGAEPENYKILDDNDLFPIVNVLPNEEDVFLKLQNIVKNKQNLRTQQKDSVRYIQRYHDYIQVAEQYLDFWEKQ